MLHLIASLPTYLDVDVVKTYPEVSPVLREKYCSLVHHSQNMAQLPSVVSGGLGILATQRARVVVLERLMSEYERGWWVNCGGLGREAWCMPPCSYLGCSNFLRNKCNNIAESLWWFYNRVSAILQYGTSWARCILEGSFGYTTPWHTQLPNHWTQVPAVERNDFPFNAVACVGVSPGNHRSSAWCYVVTISHSPLSPPLHNFNIIL